MGCVLRWFATNLFLARLHPTAKESTSAKLRFPWGLRMRVLMTVLMLSGLAAAQAASEQPANPPVTAAAPAPAAADELTVASGTKVPIVLKQTVSTKSAHEGDSVYAETTFPVVANNRVLIPAGTYVQGKIMRVQRGGHIKGRAEVLIHFTTLIYPSGYTVLLPGSIENAPAADKASVKDEEGTIQQDSQTKEKVATAAGTTGTGALIGGLSNGGKGAAIGAGIGGAVGTAIALLSRGNDVRLESGTTLEMQIQRAVPLDASRIPAVTK